MTLSSTESAMFADVGHLLDFDDAAAMPVGRHDVASCYEVSALATVTVLAAARQLERLARMAGGCPAMTVQRGLASAWFGTALAPIGWQLPPPWDSVAGDYRCRDGWLRIHTNAPHHKRRFLALFDVADERTAVAAALAQASTVDAETAIVAAGGCAARMLTEAEWAGHEQARALAAEPLIAVEKAPADVRTASVWRPTDPRRPLTGLRVLDLTRVIAGPVATRFLAASGARVLRIDPPGWDEPGVVPGMTVGKTCARLDLRSAPDRATFERLLGEAHLLVHGYRNGAMEGLGYDPARLRALSPGLVEVTLSAYGHTGPWARRRGFDSLVQMSTGIAAQGMAAYRTETPRPLPFQALDHATGYLMAAAALSGLVTRLREGRGSRACLSLARTAQWLARHPRPADRPAIDDPQAGAFADGLEHTAWGPARRLRFPVAADGTAFAFDRPACALGSSEARF